MMSVGQGSKDDLLTPPSDMVWFLEEDHYEPALEHEVESRFAVANGFLGVRGSLEQREEARRCDQRNGQQNAQPHGRQQPVQPFARADGLRRRVHR